MELQEIRQIIELMKEHGLTQFELNKEDFQLSLKKGPDMEEVRAMMAAMPSAAPISYAAAPVAAAATAPTSNAAASAPVADGNPITSPMVGTFYAKPAPDSPNFVSVGTAVSEGQTLCIIEAMKVMNEIKAEKSGTICAVIAEEGKPVQFGDILFRIK